MPGAKSHNATTVVLTSERSVPPSLPSARCRLAASMAALAPAAAPPPPGEARLSLPDGRVLTLPLLTDNMGSLFLDVRKLLAESGVCSFDPSFGSTAACTSAVTFIDGEAGVLLYRGYPIEEIAEHSDLVDTLFLLLHGELPDASERASFQNLCRSHRMVHEQLITFYKGFKSDAPPMAILVAVVGALSSFYPDSTDVSDPARRELACIRLIAKLPTIAALAFRTSIGLPHVYPRDDLGYAENLLWMMFSVPTRPFVVDKLAARVLEIILMIHCDHEQNASTSTVRIAGSSQANPFACIASGIASLWGPAHGGANEAVVRMLEEMGSVERIDEFIARAKDKSDPFRLMGFGHRVYKVRDPRAALMAKLCRQLLEHLGKTEEPLLKLALALEQRALTDPYFLSRKLYPNVDYYSGICFRALGIPISMFTPLFAVARCTGWVSQWREMVSEGTGRISRPRQMYNGKTLRKFVPVAERPPSGMALAAEGVELDAADSVAHL